MTIALRDYFAAHANIEWIKTSNVKQASIRTGVPEPSNQATDEELIEFWMRVEVAWRWKYANFMLEGQ